MQRYANDVPVNELAFNKVPFWVKVHDIPCSFLTRKVAEKLCDTVGEVRKSIGAMDDVGGSFFRVRVMVDITLPLCRGRVISLTNGSKSWVNFNYERLPSVCYWCGRLDHNDRDCELWIKSKGMLIIDQQQFGSNLRAPPYKRAARDVIYVLGYFEGRARPSQGKTMVAQPDDVAPNMGVDRWSNECWNRSCHKSPINSGGEPVTEESLNHTNSKSDFSQFVKNKLGCTDSVFPTKPNVIEDTINVSNSARSVKGKITLSELNMGKNLGDINLNPKIVELATTSRVLELMHKTLVDSNTANHAPNPTINEPLIQAIDGDVSQPANLRTWKRIIRQPKPSKVEAKVEQGEKRKSSTELTSQHDVPSKCMQVVQADQNTSNVLVEAMKHPHQEP